MGSCGGGTQMGVQEGNLGAHALLKGVVLVHVRGQMVIVECDKLLWRAGRVEDGPVQVQRPGEGVGRGGEVEQRARRDAANMRGRLYAADVQEALQREDVSPGRAGRCGSAGGAGGEGLDVVARQQGRRAVGRGGEAVGFGPDGHLGRGFTAWAGLGGGGALGPGSVEEARRKVGGIPSARCEWHEQHDGRDAWVGRGGQHGGAARVADTPDAYLGRIDLWPKCAGKRHGVGVVEGLLPWIRLVSGFALTRAVAAMVVDQDGKACCLEARRKAIDEMLFQKSELRHNIGWSAQRVFNMLRAQPRFQCTVGWARS